jgi:hypothetical protein
VLNCLIHNLWKTKVSLWHEHTLEYWNCQNRDNSSSKIYSSKSSAETDVNTPTRKTK